MFYAANKRCEELKDKIPHIKHQIKLNCDLKYKVESNNFTTKVFII